MRLLLCVRLPVRPLYVPCMGMMMVVVMMVGGNGGVLPVMCVVRSLCHRHVHGRSGVPRPGPLFGQGLELLQGYDGRRRGGPVMSLGARVEQGGLRLLPPVLKRLRSDRVSLEGFRSEPRLRSCCGLAGCLWQSILRICLILWHLLDCLWRPIGHLSRLRPSTGRLTCLWKTYLIPLWHLSDWLAGLRLLEVIGVGQRSRVRLVLRRGAARGGGLAHERKRRRAVVAPNFLPGATALSPASHVVPWRAPLCVCLGFSAWPSILPLSGRLLSFSAPRSRWLYRRMSGVVCAVGVPPSLVAARICWRPSKRIPGQLAQRSGLRGAGF